MQAEGTFILHCLKKELRMKKVELLGLSGIFICFLTPNLHGMEQKKEVKLQANDGTVVSISMDTAKLSITLRDMLEDLGAEAYSVPIPMPNINKPTLQIVVRLMEESSKPLKHQIDLIKEVIAKKNVTLDDLMNAVNYLDIEILKAPVADVMIQHLYKKHGGDRKLIASILMSMATPSSAVPYEWRNLLAKRWFLNYGKGKNFILPNLDYGFSIKELEDYNKLPKIDENGLVLSGLRINDITGLTGLSSISYIITSSESGISGLNLSNNRLTKLDPGVFSGLKVHTLFLNHNNLTKLDPGVFSGLKVRMLGLNYNNLTELDPGVFSGLKLDALFSITTTLPNWILVYFLASNWTRFLNHNNLINLKPGIFKGLKTLVDLDLSNNKISKLEAGIFEGLNILAYLNLSNNKLSKLEPKVFDSLKNLYWLGLYKNNLDATEEDRLRKELPANVTIEFVESHT